MKIDRLIGILSVLLKQDTVTAPYLAERFEVSRRTINRDIEALCRAGIPIVTTRGQGGGISIMEGYRVDKTLLTSGDMGAILAGLRSLDSVSRTNRYQQLMEKLSVGNADILASNSHILIDLSSWYKSSLTTKIELIQASIEGQRRISFLYYAPDRESRRVVEPYCLLFRWASWYVWGRCLERRDYRLFKLNRMTELTDTKETFVRSDEPFPELVDRNIFPPRLYAGVRLKPKQRWRLVEEYGPDSFEEEEDGSLLFYSGFTDQENLFGWLLSFGPDAELVEPEELREKFAEYVEEIKKLYEKHKI